MRSAHFEFDLIFLSFKRDPILSQDKIPMVNGSSGESFDAARSSVVLADSNARFVSGAAQLRVLLD